MKSVIKTISILSAFALTSQIYAGSGWTGSKKILSLETHKNGMELHLEGDTTACTNWVSGKTWASLAMSNPNYQSMSAVAMMAFVTGKSINVYCKSAEDWSPADHLKIDSQ